MILYDYSYLNLTVAITIQIASDRVIIDICLYKKLAKNIQPFENYVIFTGRGSKF